MATQTLIRFNVSVPLNQYLSIGFGADMSNVDMVVWQAYGANSRCIDLYSRQKTTPSTDSSQDYTTTFSYDSKKVYFISDRKVKTGDSLDYSVSLVSLGDIK
jgi:hypothetical protein